jgi:hypothetical protein
MANLTNPSSCPSNYKPVPDPENNNIGSMGAMLLGKLSAATQDCNVSSMGLEMAAQANGLFGAVGASAGMGLHTVDTSGCQAMQTVLGNYLNSIYQSRCLINNTSSIVTVNVTVDQNASMNASGAGTIIYPPNSATCPKPSIKQKVNLSFKDISTMSASTAADMASIVKQGMSNTMSQLGEQETGFQATPQGMSQIQGMQSKVQQSTFDTSLTNAIQSASKTITVNQNGSINASNGAVIYAPCTIDQDAILDLQLAEVISEAYAATVKSELSAFMETAQEQSVKITNKGAPNLFAEMFGSNMSMIIGLVIAVILGIFVVKFLKSKTAQDMLSKKGKLGGLSGGKLGGLSGGKLGGLASTLGGASNISSEVLPGAFRFRYY